MSLRLIDFQPLTDGIYAGSRIGVYYNFVVENGYWHNFMPWGVIIEFTLDGKFESRLYKPVVGRFLVRDREYMEFPGVMPTHDLRGQLVFKGQGAFHVGWEELGRRNVVIKSLTPGPPPNGYQCPYCPLEFPTQAQRDAHIRDVHGYEPPVPPPPPPPSYGCPYCAAAFYTQAELDAHIDRWHPVPPPGPPTHKCPYCTAAFYTRAQLDAHIEQSHPAQPPAPKPPDEVDWLKWGLIAGGIALVSVVLLSKRR